MMRLRQAAFLVAVRQYAVAPGRRCNRTWCPLRFRLVVDGSVEPGMTRPHALEPRGRPETLAGGERQVRL
jgi:hypothetical protein